MAGGLRTKRMPLGRPWGGETGRDAVNPGTVLSVTTSKSLGLWQFTPTEDLPQQLVNWDRHNSNIKYNSALFIGSSNIL